MTSTCVEINLAVAICDGRKLGYVPVEIDTAAIDGLHMLINSKTLVCSRLNVN